MNTTTIQRIDTLIIGAGLSGIYAASRLAEQNRSFVLLEARNRIGGRILCPQYEGYGCDLGPSWYWPEIHPTMARLVDTLNLKGYRQFENGFGRYQQHSGAVHTIRGYGSEPASWRIVGGMMALVTRLCERVLRDTIRLNHPVCGIERRSDGIRVTVGELEKAPWAEFLAQQVVLALPPRLTAATILFTPDLPDHLAQAMLKTSTWMAGQAKFYALYETPFWRDAGLSGQAFSEHGPLGEIHDGSNHVTAPYGLTGFVGMPAAQRNQQPCLNQAIREQLADLFGWAAATPTRLFYQDWARESFTATAYDQPPLRAHPDYRPPAGQSAIWDGRVHFAGTETADQHGGYLEGALRAAERAINNLQSK
ncbi:Amine oxidase [Desulfosarcina cetonica]|uniref:flavin monoamine oxidase family protein n=1 Tax=Desulfosarcina cetonica TaxID=90730 RepID=UPI0006D2AC76|nr:FAD-dependent oxidoreductase [Desulfosarcina cetonica]VTR64219.1 Amine oxidase [Desulfosarcina cetonica]